MFNAYCGSILHISKTQQLSSHKLFMPHRIWQT